MNTANGWLVGMFLHVLVVGQALTSSLAGKALLLQTLDLVQQFLLIDSSTRLFVVVVQFEESCVR